MDAPAPTLTADPDLARLLAAPPLAAAVAALAWRAGSLARGGAAAATVVGALAVAAGWGWAALLLVFFVSGSALSRLGRAAKEARTGAVVEKGGRRDAAQVLANGGPFALAALGALVSPHPAWAALGAGSLAAAAADTWGTEIGTLLGGTPHSLRTGRPVPAGTSGAVSAAGILATLAGAAVLGTTAHLAGLNGRAALAVAVGGAAGAAVDTLLGATVQARRLCPRCDAVTERIVHPCGERTRPAGGVPWVDNDTVNLLATLAGGLLAALGSLAA